MNLETILNSLKMILLIEISTFKKLGIDDKEILDNETEINNAFFQLGRIDGVQQLIETLEELQEETEDKPKKPVADTLHS